MWQSSSGSEYVLAVLIFAGGWMAWVTGRDLYYSLAARSWPRARGEIVESQLVSGASVVKWKGRLIAGELIRYSYQVRNRRHAGERVRFAEFSLWGAKRAVRRYPVGARVEVLYHPDRPALAALEAGTSFMGVVQFLMALAFFGLLLRVALLQLVG
ncbi:MAG TPA: DUF3592 domain-containing protein [Longimicrobium sp.]|nr:DUF3592 domain-containing protein [Longimicrobium sp.]